VSEAISIRSGEGAQIKYTIAIRGIPGVFFPEAIAIPTGSDRAPGHVLGLPA
jgi:hypothetical protein